MLYLLLALPSLILVIYTQDTTTFLLSLYILVYLYALLKTTKYNFVLLPFLLIVPLNLYYIFLFKSVLSEQILSIVLETNVQEGWHFIGARIYFYISIFFLWVIFCLYFCYKNFKQPKVWKHRSRYWILAVGFIHFSFMFFLQQQISRQIDQATEAQENFLVREKNGFLQDIKQTYPLGLIVSIYDLWIEQQKIQQAFQHNQKFKFNAQQIKNPTQKEVYILVIGETSRRSNWQLNGYVRGTNPQLSQQRHLVNFPNFLAISTETRTSIPVMLTRKPAQQVYQFNFNEKSILSAFKEAGFKTYWLSMQQKFGAFDTSTSVYAKEAEYMQFLNHTDYKNSGGLDTVLLPELTRIIQNDENKQFIVLHTLGSHYNYAHRYSKEFNHFRPSLTDISGYSLQDIKYKQELLNSYDNSILFTDQMLNGVIEALKKQNIVAFMLYSSDHGEDLFDQNCEQSGHGLRTVNNLEISGFAWYSDKYAQINPKKIAQLHHNASNRLNQKIIFPTLLDAADIYLPKDPLDKSMLKKLDVYPRFVLGGINYDTALKEGKCQEIR